MHQWSLSELWGVSTWRGAPARGTTGGRASRSSGPSGGSAPCRLRPPRGASLWAWLLLGALVPGAWSFLNEVEEELLVELHNHYRGQVSPTASAMLPLKWDPNLKLVAESYAAKCIWNHNPDLEDTGENLFAGTGPLDLREALEKWFLERLDYNYENNSCDEDKMCGHYKQMVWADTHRVGCAFHLCNMMEGLDWERVSFLVCNYYPAGNYETVRPYEEGECCSSCPDNLQLCENNLCVAANMGDDEEEVDAEEEEEELYENRGTATPPQATSDPSIQSGEEKAWELTPFLPGSDHDTTSPSTPPPGTLSPVETEEEKMEEEEEEKEETSGKKDAEKKTDESKEEVYDAGSVASPSLVLACLTGILMLRL